MNVECLLCAGTLLHSDDYDVDKIELSSRLIE